VAGGWWLVAGGGWRLAVGGWRLAFDWGRDSQSTLRGGVV